MQYISEKRFIEAAETYYKSSPLPEICSRVCPQENLCEGACVLTKHGQAVALGALERFVTDYARTHRDQLPQRVCAASSGKAVAIVGAGPAGLSTALRLLELGHAVTLYKRNIGGQADTVLPTNCPVLSSKPNR
jgi:glutamate synthase (NADPH/NADH) small chain